MRGVSSPCRRVSFVGPSAQDFSNRTDLYPLNICGRNGAASPEVMSQATTGDVNVTSSSKELSLPDFPGEDFLAHAGTQWLESAEAKLAGKQLLAVAQGHEPPAVKCIVDIDLSELPTLPTSHRDHDRREETRIKR